MKMRRFSLAFICLFAIALGSCDVLGHSDTFPYSKEQVSHVMDSVAKIDGGTMYADAYCKLAYSMQKADSIPVDTFFWVSPYGVDERAEILLSWLSRVEEQGLKAESFCVSEIDADLKAFRKLKPDSCTQAEVCDLMGRLEYRLSRAFFRYIYGQRFGYVRPNEVFNEFLTSKKTDAYRRVFDVNFEHATDSLVTVATNCLLSSDDMNDFLEEQQPTDSLYYRLCREYVKAKEAGDSKLLSLARLNLERSRWRYPRPENKGKYVHVNVPAFMLEAVDADNDKKLRMKVCCGKSDHQTPLLTSAISRLELNPYWNVPYNIIKNEVAPRHTGDVGYFSRNRMVAIDHSTGAEISASSLSADQWISGRYGLRQDRGAGNSLGRLIFRFPNSHAVYLHDTNSPGAFGKAVRAVSHGCVRVQKPLDLAIFLMDNPSDLLKDKIRVAIDKAPLSEDGRKYKEKTDPEKYMKSYKYSPAVPVFIDYYTLYPDSSGTFRSYDDVYGYDKPLKKALDAF